jgi:hypothetical protein
MKMRINVLPPRPKEIWDYIPGQNKYVIGTLCDADVENYPWRPMRAWYLGQDGKEHNSPVTKARYAQEEDKIEYRAPLYYNIVTSTRKLHAGEAIAIDQENSVRVVLKLTPLEGPRA